MVGVVAALVVGLVSPATEQLIATFMVMAVESVIWKTPAVYSGEDCG
jgi:hypothetical protein